jgi:hypothetical protein
LAHQLGAEHLRFEFVPSVRAWGESPRLLGRLASRSSSLRGSPNSGSAIRLPSRLRERRR